ncbi:amidohydrolase [Pedomonas mirosovicensis]|uniref:amidohydrolase n=1 Tax=Pedomonas mirosovicensis TaxID=2908641 RepID=UPI002168F43D|nr:amidohydrolase [Pedomonas mirosovicensis]MCH8684351.1 amidohydrolase [Pedomonas mirosovicensis]
MRLLVTSLAAMLVAMPACADSLRNAVLADLPYVQSLYIELHKAPELSFHETRSSARMAEELKKAGFTEVTTGVGGHGVVGVLRNGEGPTLLIRADMDALPVKEQTGLPYASTVTTKDDSGAQVPVMHACGHDIHMSAWVGAARRLAALKDQWKGTLVMVAQPAEERGGGAKAMLDDGLYARFPKPDHVIALHVNAGLPAGSVGVHSGFAMANVDSVDVTVRGIGGHGAYPQTTRDPVVLAAHIVTALQTLVSRNTDPSEPAVVTVGSIHGGTKHNIIPDTVKLQLTVRSYTDEVRENLLSGIKRVAEGEAIAFGLPQDLLPVVEVKDEYTPAVFNTEAQSARLAGVFKARFGENRVVETQPVMGGEDFARYYRADRSLESTLFWLGAVKRATWEEAQKSGKPLPSLHSPFFAPDPQPTLATGIEAMTAAALSVLGR